MLMKTLQLLFRGFIFALACALLAGPAHADFFVTCLGTNNVQTLSSSGASDAPISGGNLGRPVAIAIDAAGNLYVCNDQSPYFIEKYSSTGTDLGAFTTATSLNRPYGLAFDSSGNLYAANYGNNTIEKFSSTGADLGAFVNSGLSGPIGLAFDSSGILYVVNSGTNTIGEFSAAGGSVGTITSTNLSFPYRVAFDPTGNLYVTSYGNSLIEKFSSAGVDLGIFASTGLNGPAGLVFDASGNLYACNEDASNIEKYAPDGTDLGAFGNVAGNSATASDIALYSGGQIEFSAAAYQTSEDAGTVTITANRVGGSNGATSASYTTTDGSAVAGTDYTAASGTLSWENGDAAAKTFTVAIHDRGITNGGSVRFSVVLLGSSGTGTFGTPAAATVTINDNDMAPAGQLAFSAAAYPAFEDQGNVTITVARSGGSSGATDVTYTTSNGTAVAGTDYTATSGVLSWEDGEATAKTFQVPILDRHITTGASADFLVSLIPFAGTATLGNPAQATVTIDDNDASPTGQLAFSAAAYPAFEDQGNVTITVARTGSTSGAASVAYATSNGQAVAGTDYTAASGTLSWASGEATAKTFQVPILDRHITSGASADFLVTLSQVAGTATLGTAQATVTITDNDTPLSSNGVVSITQPAGNIVVPTGTTVDFAAQLARSHMNDQVQFFVNQSNLGDAFTVPGSGIFNGADEFDEPGTYVFEAVATDSNGNETGSASVTITVYAEPTVTINSPPRNLTVLEGTTIPLEAEVTDPDHQISSVHFIVANVDTGDLGKVAPFTSSFMADANAVGGNPVLAEITLLDGTVIDSAERDIQVTPLFGTTLNANSATLFALLDGVHVAQGSTLLVTVISSSELSLIEFYVDGVLIATDDGSGHPVAARAPGRGVVTRDASASSGSGVFQFTYQVPANSKPVSLTAVATTSDGVSFVSAPVHVNPVAVTGAQPVVTVGDFAGGQPVKAGVSFVAPVTVSTGSTPITMVQYFLNGTLVSASAAPPYSVTVTPPKAGAYALTAVATDVNQVSTVSAPLVFTAVPTVSLSVKGDGMAVVGGEAGKVIFTRAGDDLSQPLTVFFKLTGTAVDGVNYTHVGKKVVIPAGTATYKLKIKPLDTMTGPLALKVGVKLLPAPDGSYAPGDVVKAKLMLEQTQ